MTIPLSAATCFIRGTLTQPLVTWPPTAFFALSCCRVTKLVRKATNSRMSEASTRGHKFTSQSAACSVNGSTPDSWIFSLYRSRSFGESVDAYIMDFADFLPHARFQARSIYDFNMAD
ncbi:hypothetical protein HPB52_016021 [Rhipicephalus sanguineus]|uniref:Uncharacterized protein n=1 Tax=Rhipicephalus sanguineus TaxID=34632 RepID=A0A9D4YQA1_RHISA|nr:hypothetical protein HPB52_016021 [Rhipicephalus sanguineus]